MTITTLKYFVAIVEKKSFSQVAQEMYISQPTISRAIANFEKELGVTLLNRNNKLVECTEAGLIVYDACKRVLNDLEHMDEALNTLRINQSRFLRIAYHHFDALLADMLLNSLQALSSTHQEITTAIVDFGTIQDLPSALLYNIDIAFAPIADVQDMKNVSFMPMYHDPLVAVFRPSHPLSQMKTVSINDLRPYMIMLAETNDAALAHKRIIEELVEHGYKSDDITILPSHDHIYLNLATTDNIGLMAESLYEDKNHKALKTLNCAIVSDCRMNFDVALAWRKDNPNNSRKHFIEAISEYAKF